MKDNVDIADSSKYKIEFRKESSQYYVSVLTINNVASVDYGSYLCEARSEIGAIAEKATLSGKRKYIIKTLNLSCEKINIKTIFILL